MDNEYFIEEAIKKAIEANPDYTNMTGVYEISLNQTTALYVEEK